MAHSYCIRFCFYRFVRQSEQKLLNPALQLVCWCCCCFSLNWHGFAFRLGIVVVVLCRTQLLCRFWEEQRCLYKLCRKRWSLSLASISPNSAAIYCPLPEVESFCLCLPGSVQCCCYSSVLLSSILWPSFTFGAAPEVCASGRRVWCLVKYAPELHHHLSFTIPVPAESAAATNMIHADWG